MRPKRAASIVRVCVIMTDWYFTNNEDKVMIYVHQNTYLSGIADKKRAVFMTRKGYGMEERKTTDDT